MTLRRKSQLITVSTIGGFVLVLVFAVSVSGSMPLLVIGLYILAATVISVLVRCPECGKPLNWNPVFRLGRYRAWGWTVDTPRKCTRCTAPFE